MGVAAVWSIVRIADDDLVGFSQSPTFGDAWRAAVDWLQDRIGVRLTDLDNDEWELVNTTFVNPTVADIHGYTITTEPAS